MDKKMHKVTEKIRSAERDLDKGRPGQAKSVLKRAAKENEKLVRIDRDVRDPLIEKCEKGMKSSKRAKR